MPPFRQKRLVLCLAGLLGFSCALLSACALVLPRWVRGTVLCRTGAELVNASGPDLDKFLGQVEYGLLHATRVKQCGLGGRPTSVSVFPQLLVSIPVVLHVSVLFFCGVVILFSCVSTGFFFFNAFGRPYETLQGPMGLYLWTFISCVCSFLVLVLFAAEVKLYHLSERISNFNEVNFVFQTFSESYSLCFWLLLLVLLLHLLNLLLIRTAGAKLPFTHDKEAEPGGGGADLLY